MTRPYPVMPNPVMPAKAGTMLQRHCERSEAIQPRNEQDILSGSLVAWLDCFATLAMTVWSLFRFLTARARKVACAGLILLAATSTASAAQKLSYEPAVVQLSGTVVTQQFYGPPNYGADPATDSKEQAILLNLDSSIDVIATSHAGFNQNSFYNEQRVQLAGQRASSLANMIGQHVTLRGMLFGKEDGHHHTDVLMDVSEVIPSHQSSS